MFLSKDTYILIFQYATGEFFDLYTFKNLRQTCKQFKFWMDTYVPFRAQEFDIELQEHQQPYDEFTTNYVDFQKNILLYINKFIALLYPSVLYLIYSPRDVEEDIFVHNILQNLTDWYNINTCSWSLYISTDQYTQYEQKRYNCTNMLLIVNISKSNEKDALQPSLWKLVDSVLRHSGKVIFTDVLMDNEENSPLANREYLVRYPVKFLNATGIDNKILWPQP